MKEINLTQGQVALVDDEDYEELNKYKWFAHDNYGWTFYARRTGRKADGKRYLIQMHRVILNAPKDMFVDHIDSNGLNNQRSNLRLCTNQQNNRHARPYSNGSSKFKGVCWHKRIKEWQANIRIDGKLKHIGYFKNEKDAALAYNVKALEYFGEFALPNEI